MWLIFFFFFQAEDGIRDDLVTGVQTCAFRSRTVDSRESPPLAAGAQDVQDGVDDLAQVDGARPTNLEPCRQQRLQEDPLAIAQIARIASGSHTHPYCRIRATPLRNSL